LHPSLLDHAGKSAIVFSLMIDGSSALSCRILGKSRPVRIVMKRGAISALERSRRRLANRSIHWDRNCAQTLLIAGVDKSGAKEVGESASVVLEP
jgi:hypothetical protein